MTQSTNADQNRSKHFSIANCRQSENQDSLQKKCSNRFDMPSSTVKDCHLSEIESVSKSSIEDQMCNILL